MTQSSGRIDIILGPMRAGKTSEMIRRLRRYNIVGKRALVAKYKHDTRDNDLSNIYTHDGTNFPSVSCNLIAELINHEDKYDILAIDEGQFFSDLVPEVTRLKGIGKWVVISALHSTYNGEEWPNGLFSLIAISFDIVKLHAVCEFCKQDANNSCRKSADKSLVVIDSKEKKDSIYIALCDGCCKNFRETSE